MSQCSKPVSDLTCAAPCSCCGKQHIVSAGTSGPLRSYGETTVEYEVFILLYGTIKCYMFSGSVLELVALSFLKSVVETEKFISFLTLLV